MSEYTIHPSNLQQDAEKNLKAHMLYRGLLCDHEIFWDGSVHRYSSRGLKDKDEWYIASQVAPGKFICTYASYRLGNEKHTFRSYDKNDFPEEKKILENLTNKIIIAEKAHIEEKIKEANELWDAITKDETHPYLENKKLPALNVKMRNGDLYIPMYTIEGKLTSLQKISKEKRFYPGIPVKGLIHILGNIDLKDEVFVCEGYATGLSIHLATDTCVVVAFSASQLIATGLMLTNQYPSKKIKLGADSDKVGRDQGDKWKECINQYVYYAKNKDFNDDWVLLGKEKVREAFFPKAQPKTLMQIIQESVKEDEKLNDAIFQGSVAIIFGDAGVGKSRIVTEMAFCLAIKERFLQLKAHRKSKVLLIDGEMTDWDIQSRMKSMLDRYKDFEGDISEDCFQIMSNKIFRDQYDQEINLYNEAHREIIGNLFKEFDVLVLDNFNSLTSSSMESDGQDVIFQKKNDWKKFFSWLKAFRNEGKTTIVVMHSTKNGEALQGVMEMRADATTILKVRKPKKPIPGNAWKEQGELLLDFVVEYDKARNIPLYLQSPFRASLLSKRETAYGWKYDELKSGSEE